MQKWKKIEGKYYDLISYDRIEVIPSVGCFAIKLTHKFSNDSFTFGHFRNEYEAHKYIREELIN